MEKDSQTPKNVPGDAEKDHDVKSDEEQNHISEESVVSEERTSSDASMERESQPPEERESTLKWVFICGALYSGSFLYGLDSTISADVQGPIVSSLGHIQLLPWVGIGFPLGSVSTVLLTASLYDKFEIKWIYLGSTVIFAIGSAVCGAAPNINALIVGRIIAGIGGAGRYLGNLRYLGLLTSLKRRAAYFAGLGIFFGIGAILGPAIGGAFASSSATWRWSFYINVVLTAVIVPILVILPRHNPHPETLASKKVKLIDWIGFLLNAACFCLFVVGLTFAGSTWKWNSAATIITFTFVVIILAGFAIQQIFSIFTTPEYRLFPVDFLRNRTIILMFIGTATVATAMFFAIYYVPLFFQFTRGDTAIHAAVRLLPFVVVFVVFIMISGTLLPYVGRYMPTFFISGILIIIASSLMFTVDKSTSTGMIYSLEVILALGAGIAAQLGYTIAATEVPTHKAGTAISFINVAQIGSGTISLAVSGCIFENLGYINLRNALADYSFTRQELLNALSGTQSTVLTSGSEKIRELAVGAIAKTISTGYALVIGAGALLVAASLMMKRGKLQLK